MSAEELDRVAREKHYHDRRFTRETRQQAAKYYGAASSGINRYKALVAEVRPGCRVLEYGCGKGSAAFGLAALGANVTGIDISPVAVDEARAEAARSAHPERMSFHEMNAERLEFPDGAFDFVCGSGILHHLELRAAFAEVSRTLGPLGRGVFYEPMGHNPLINLYRRLTPSMRTPDEHPLRMSDFDLARRYFNRVDTEFFELTSIAGGVLSRLPGGRQLTAALRRLDRALMHRFPPLRRWAWIVVVQVELPRGST